MATGRARRHQGHRENQWLTKKRMRAKKATGMGRIKGVGGDGGDVHRQWWRVPTSLDLGYEKGKAHEHQDD